MGLIIAICLVELFILLALTENEWGSVAAVTLVITLGVLQFWQHVDILGFVQTHALEVAGGAVVYFAVGILWSIIKWYWYVGDEVNRVKDQRSANQSDESWKEELKRRIPSPARYKDRIMRWIGYWPISVFWFVVHDLVMDVLNFLYNRFAGVYRKITEAAITRLMK